MTTLTHYDTYFDLINDNDGLFKMGLLWWCMKPRDVDDYEFSWAFLKQKTSKEIRDAMNERMMDYYNSYYIKVPTTDDYKKRLTRDYCREKDGFIRIYALTPLLEILEQVYRLDPQSADTMSHGLLNVFHEVIQKNPSRQYVTDFLDGANMVVRCFRDAGLIEEDLGDIYNMITEYAKATYGIKFSLYR